MEAVSTLRGGEVAAAGALGAVSVTGGVALFIQVSCVLRRVAIDPSQ